METFHFKYSGTFLDVGCGHPRINNNTWLLEKNYAWTGCSIDDDPELIDAFRKERHTMAVLGDALVIDYTGLSADYLSLDIDHQSLLALERILEFGCTFGCITFEHDNYRFGPVFRDKSRELLSEDYWLYRTDVTYCCNGFEDWWIRKCLSAN